MIRKTTTGGAVLLLLTLAACDTGPYDPSAHHHADASTGSLLSGTDTGVSGDGNINGNPSISNNFGGAAARGR